MTELRKQLLAGQTQYQAARYPGDLAADVLPPQISPQRHFPLKRVVGIAAAILLVVMVRTHRSQVMVRTHGSPSNTRSISASRRPLALPHQLAGGTVEMPAIPATPRMPSWPSHANPGTVAPSPGELRAPLMPSAPAWPAQTPLLPPNRPEPKSPQEAI